MGNGTIDGFLDAVLDRGAWMDAGLGIAGGAVGGVGLQMLSNNVAFLHEGGKNVKLLKHLGAASLIAFTGGMLGAKANEEAAKGFVGGVGSQMGLMLMATLAPTALAVTPEVAAASAASAATTPPAVAGLSAMRSSRIQLANSGLASTRSYSGDDLPAGVGGLGRVNVSTPDQAELASLMAIS